MQKYGAWKGNLGLELHPDLFLDYLMLIIDENINIIWLIRFKRTSIAISIENTDKMAKNKLAKSYFSLLETPLAPLLEGISKREKYDHLYILQKLLDFTV